MKIRVRRDVCFDTNHVRVTSHDGEVDSVILLGEVCGSGTSPTDNTSYRIEVTGGVQARELVKDLRAAADELEAVLARVK